MTETAPSAHGAGTGKGRTRLLVLAAPRIDDLAGRVVAEVERSLPRDMEGLRVGTTSVAPRDEAARAARWVARLGARLGVPTSVTFPSASGRPWAALSPPARPAGRRPDDATPAPTSVGISRLDLAPEMEAVDQPFAVGVWLPLRPSPPWSRSRLEPDAALVEAAADAAPACTCLIGTGEGMAIAVVGADLLAAEVLGRAIRAAAQPVGDRGLSPWEAPVVQRGIELGLGVTHPDRILVESLWLGEDVDPRHERFHRIVAIATARAGVRESTSARRGPWPPSFQTT